MQGADALFGGFNAGMNAIRARNEERDNISYFSGRCREMEEWGEKGWAKVSGLVAENAQLRKENAALTQKAEWAAGNMAMSKDLLGWMREDLASLRREIARLKSDS